MFKKPNTKTISDAGMTAVSFVAGAKIGDGISAVMPESTASYKAIALGALGIVLAASINANTPVTKAAQSAFLGMGAKQLCDVVTDKLTTAVGKQGTTGADGVVSLSTVQKFINGAVGHLGSPYALGAAAWDFGQVPSQTWDRPELLEAVPFDPASMV